MARLRPIQHGYVYSKGPSWMVQWREDQRQADGTLARVKMKQRLCSIVNFDGTKVTKREAERLANDTVIAKLNHVSVMPRTLVTFEEFWKQRFIPDHVEKSCKAAGQAHYDYMGTVLLPDLGPITLREITPELVQLWLNSVKKKNGDPFSSQTMLHFRNALSAMFRLADDLGFLPGANPASKVRCPRLVRKPRRILTLEEAYKLLAALPTPTREAAKLSMITGLNVAEMFGLNRECVNLRAEPVLTQDGVIPGYCAAIRRNYFRQVLDTVKTAARRRIVPLTPGLVAMLRELMATSKRQEPDAPVFQTPSGTRLDANNQAGRVLRPIAKLVLKRGVGWHEFRHAAATSSELVEMPLSERTALLGHAQAAMTNYYTDADLARRRPYLERMELLIEAAGKAEEGRQVS